MSQDLQRFEQKFPLSETKDQVEDLHGQKKILSILETLMTLDLL
jgi:hypothetical protein